MLPFPKRKNDESIELGDDDIVVLHEQAIELDVDSDDVEVIDADAPARLPPVTPPPARLALRKLVTGSDAIEDDVADECLASIAAATSHARLSDRFPASIVPPPPRMPRFVADVDELLAATAHVDHDADATSRLPPVTVPPFRRASIARDSVPGLAAVPSEPSTPSAFVRTSSPSLPAVANSIAPVAASIAPASSSAVEPTVVLVHRPPRTGWIVASAICGAAAAIAAMYMLMPARSAAEPEPTNAVAVAPAPSPAPSPIAAPAAPAAPEKPAKPAVVRFDEAHGVAVVTPKPAAQPIAALPLPPAAPTAPAAKASPAKAKAKTATSAPAPTTSAPPLLPDPPTPKRKLTPAQELADAQLKASMK